MESESTKTAVPEESAEPASEGRYEPPTIRELGSLRDLVAANGNTIPDGHGLGPG